MSQDPWHAPPYWSSKTEQNTHTFPRGDAVFKWGGLLILEARAGDTRALIADLIIYEKAKILFSIKKNLKKTKQTAQHILLRLSNQVALVLKVETRKKLKTTLSELVLMSRAIVGI